MSGQAGVEEDSLTLHVHDLRVQMMPGQIVRVADFSVLYDGDQEVTIFWLPALPVSALEERQTRSKVCHKGGDQS